MSQGKTKNLGEPTPYGNDPDPTLEQLVERMDLSDDTSPALAVNVLREAIITGVLRAGTSLKQDHIAEKLGVSKIPVREAMRELEGLGLVEAVRNRGFVVSQTSLDEMYESFKLRRMLELFAVRESVPKATDADHDAVDAIIDACEQITDVRVSSSWNLRLHLALYAPARMIHLEKMIRRAHTISHRYTHTYMRMTHQTVDSQDEHRAILHAFRQRDVELAVTLMDSHISVAANQYSEFLRTHLTAEGAVNP